MYNVIQTEADNCPRETDLLRFARGELPLEVIDRIGAHLESCESCSSFIDTDTANFDTVIEEVRGAIDESTASNDALLQEPEFLRLRNDAQAIVVHDGDSTAAWDHVGVPTDAEFGETHIGPYFVLAKLGQGGFAQVYLAKDPKHNRRVAIKVARRDKLSSAEHIEGFLREARTAASLDHPNIVPVFDYGRMEDGRCFVVMKYIEGRSLADAIRSERFDQRRAADLIAQLADAVDYAHQRGFIHRDIKPANVLLDKHGVPHITDFGLALHEDRQHLHADELAGTYAYMSPEQIRGESHHLDGRTDIWSLGVVFYELLTHARPFQGGRLAELKAEIERRPPKPPRQFDDSISKRLEQACLKCLNKEPTERYSTAAELSHELHSSIQQRGRVLVAAAGIVLVLLALAAALGPRLEKTTPGNNVSGDENVASTRPPIGEWVSFMDRTPVPLTRNLADELNVWRPLPEQERFEVRSGADICAALYGKQPENDFRIKVDLNIDRWFGISGIVLGLHEPPHARPQTMKRCYAICLGRILAEQQITLEFREVVFESTSSGGFRVTQKKELATARLKHAPAGSVTLEIVVADGHINEVRVADRPVHLQGDLRMDVPTNLQAEFGLTSIGSLCVFENGSFMRLHQE